MKKENLIAQLFQDFFPFPIHDVKVKELKRDVYEISWEWSRHNVSWNSQVMEINGDIIESGDTEIIEEYFNNLIQDTFNE